MWRGDNGKDYQSVGASYTAGPVNLGYALQLARQDSEDLLHLFSIDGSF